MPEPSAPLAGLGVAVTRPEHQAEDLARRLTAAGARVLRFPAIRIEGLPPDAPSMQPLRDLAGYDLVVFISPNAATHALDAWGDPLPLGPRVAVVGAGTARALEARGARIDLVPRDGYNSEGLLALEPLRSVAGQRVLIVRGAGGRELLATTLRERGAEVIYAEVYRRTRPPADPEVLLRPWRKGQLQALIVTSGEGLANLFEMLGEPGSALLHEATLVVGGERLAQLARAHGCRRMVVAPRVDDQSLIDSLSDWWSGHPVRPA